MDMVLFLFVLSTLRATQSSELNTNQIFFVILSQPGHYHSKMAAELEGLLIRYNVSSSSILNTVNSEYNLQHGAWTLMSLMKPLIKILRNRDIKVMWVVFLTEMTFLNNLIRLVEVLSDRYKNPHSNEIFIGHALRDEEPSIVHHFSEVKAEYPDVEAGFCLSIRLVESLATRITKHGSKVGGYPQHFSIDPAYELAKVIRSRSLDPETEIDELFQYVPIQLNHESIFCLFPDSNYNCATFPLPNHSLASEFQEDIEILSEHTLFAVKTCQKFHAKRLSVINDTWVKAAPNVLFFSDSTDPVWPTMVLPGVKHAKKGHCSKSFGIIRYFHNLDDKYKWLVMVDDDTMLSAQKLLELLFIFDDQHYETVALGQRYGYRNALGDHEFDYPTGGSGMIFNRKMISKIMMNSAACGCPHYDDPDDMQIGICLANLAIPLLHTVRLHQARPEEYDKQMLLHQDPISFHTFGPKNPRLIYEKWFRPSDLLLTSYKAHRSKRKLRFHVDRYEEL